MTYWKPRNKDEDEKDETPLLSKSGSEIHSSFKSSKWFGIFLAAASGLLLTLYSALYKSIKTDIDNSTILVLRGLIQVSVMGVILGINRVNISPQNMDEKTKFQKVLIWLGLVCVCAVGGIRLCFIFAALQRIPMALVHTLLNGSPVLVMALSHFFLKDRCNILRTGCTLGLVAGVILIFQPQAFVNSTQLSSTQNQNYTMINPTSILSSAGNMKSKAVEEISKISEKSEARDGYIFSVGALVLSALSAVLTKKITKHFEKILISLYLGISIGSVGLMQLLIFNPKAPTLPESPYPWLIAILVACLGMTQQFCLIAALKLESATRVTLIRSLQIVVSFIIQIQVWNETPGLDQVAGVICVMSAIAVVTLEDAITDEVQRCCGCKESHIESE